MPAFTGATEATDSTALAHKLLNAQGCKACHSFGNEGGKYAGSLEEAGQKLTAGEIREQLVNPDRRHGNNQIRDFGHLSTMEIDALVEFIQPRH